MGLDYSGICYLLPPSSKGRLYNQPMLDEVDVRHAFKEPANSFWGMVGQIFHCVMGNHFDLCLDEKGRKGLLDLLLFPLISRIAVYYFILSLTKLFPAWHLRAMLLPDDEGRGREFKGLDYFFLGLGAILTFIIAVPLEILRGVLGAAVTLVLTPFVMIWDPHFNKQFQGGQFTVQRDSNAMGSNQLKAARCETQQLDSPSSSISWTQNSFNEPYVATY